VNFLRNLIEIITDHLQARDKWTIRGIAWLMVQIWFGNTYLSFGQATSFHPVFGPILMTCFAALSGTLLLTSASLVNHDDIVVKLMY